MAKRSVLRNFLMHGFHLLVMMVVGNQIRDTQCGFKVMVTVVRVAGWMECVFGSVFGHAFLHTKQPVSSLAFSFTLPPTVVYAVCGAAAVQQPAAAALVLRCGAGVSGAAVERAIVFHRRWQASRNRRTGRLLALC